MTMYNDTSIIDIFDKLKETSGAKNKKNILLENENNPVFLETLKVALDPYIVFYATELPLPSKDLTDYYLESVISLTLNECDLSASRESIRNTLQWLSNLCGMDERKRAFWSSVVAKDLTCGVGAKTVNTTYKNNLINTFSPMKGEEASHLTKMELPLVVQDKLDGTRCLIYIDSVYDGIVEIFSSSGRPYPNFKQLKADILENARELEFKHPVFLDTELVFVDDEGEQLPREISNGLANRSLNGSNTDDVEEKGIFYCFDMMGEKALSEGDSISYDTRFQSLAFFLSDFNGSALELVPHQVCNTLHEVYESYDKAVEQRKEGIMVKTLNHPYEPKRSKHWCKIKRQYTISMEVVEVQEHKKKCGHIGALIVQSSDGKIKGKVGSGLNDEDRMNMDFVGSIVEVKIHDLTVKKGEYSMYLPRFVEIRNDKEEADSSEKIFEMLNWER